MYKFVHKLSEAFVANPPACGRTQRLIREVVHFNVPKPKTYLTGKSASTSNAP